MAVSFLRDMVHPDVPFSPRAVKFFLQTLNHDSISLRKVELSTDVRTLLVLLNSVLTDCNLQCCVHSAATET